MPWAPARFTEIDERVSPSFLPNNLAGDGEGRFAFAHGGSVQCTRKHSKKQGRNDFTLAMKTEGVEVMQVYWWQNVPRYTRPLLVLVTDAPNAKDVQACLQVWDTRSGRGARIFNLNFEEKVYGNIFFGRGLSSAQGAHNEQVLFVGLSSGDLVGYQVNKRGQLETACRLRGLSSAVSCVAGDKMPSPYIAAADENGNVMVWLHRNGSWQAIYRYKDSDDDYCCSLGLRGRILVGGHASGKISFHDLDDYQKLAETVTNSKGITSIDMHPTQGIFLVTGEDCRATVLALPTDNGENLRVVLSVCLNGVILGGSFTCAKPDMPDITLLMWERTHLVQYDFHEA
jgi:WD40 repeat protein